MAYHGCGSRAKTRYRPGGSGETIFEIRTHSAVWTSVTVFIVTTVRVTNVLLVVLLFNVIFHPGEGGIRNENIINTGGR